MPAKNTVKTYVADGYYHVYNRGVEKRNIFFDDSDYTAFLHFLKQALLPPLDHQSLSETFTLKGSTFKGIPKQPKNFYGKIELTAFVLMPNHFHLLLKQKGVDELKQFMQSICTRQSIRINTKHKRVGPLFQGIYKAVNIDSDEYLLHLSRYIHRNPLNIGVDLKKGYSSYRAYLGEQNIPWLHPHIVTSFFTTQTLPYLKNKTTYQQFVEDTEENNGYDIQNLSIDDQENDID